MSVDGQSVGLDSIDTILEGLSGKVLTTFVLLLCVIREYLNSLWSSV